MSASLFIPHGATRPERGMKMRRHLAGGNQVEVGIGPDTRSDEPGIDQPLFELALTIAHSPIVPR